MAFLVTFLEGVVTFVSPCLLPMLPIYLAFFAGSSAAERASETPAEIAARTRRTLARALCFVAGFALVFCVLGATAGTVGRLLAANQRVLDIVCGVIVVVFGLHYLGVLRIPLLDRTFGPQAKAAPTSLAAAFVFGMVFAIGWTPCVGTFLASALSLAASSGSTLVGVALLACFSLGLGLPFVLAALLLDQLRGALAWLRAHARTVELVSGSLLVVVGVLMATGTFGAWLRLLS